MHAVQAILVVQMRRISEPGHPDITDGLSLDHPAADSGGAVEPGHMCIKRRDIAAMLHDYRVAVAVFSAAKDNFSVAGRLDRCASGRRVVDTAVCTNRIENRMLSSWIET